MRAARQQTKEAWLLEDHPLQHARACARGLSINHQPRSVATNRQPPAVDDQPPAVNDQLPLGCQLISPLPCVGPLIIRPPKPAGWRIRSGLAGATRDRGPSGEPSSNPRDAGVILWCRPFALKPDLERHYDLPHHHHNSPVTNHPPSHECHPVPMVTVRHHCIPRNVQLWNPLRHILRPCSSTLCSVMHCRTTLHQMPMLSYIKCPSVDQMLTALDTSTTTTATSWP